MMESSLEEKSKQVERKVSKAFLITGGSEESRQAKYVELYRADVYLMYASYEGDDALAVIFSANHSDFDGMTFDEAARIAGETALDANYKTSTFGREERFGTIELPSQSSSLRM